MNWTPLEGTHAIDASVVAGFLFPSDPGGGRSITVAENGNRAVRISISREQDFGMYLVVVLRHEEWTTTGNFHLRFLRRVPVPDKGCTARPEGPFAGPVASPSDSDLGNAKAPESSTTNAASTITGEQRLANWVASISPSRVPPQTPSRGSSEDAFVAPLDRQPWTPEYVGETTGHGDTMEHEDTTEEGDTTEEEDYLTIGAAALRG